jgi:ribonuclease HII
LLVDGNYFKPYNVLNKEKTKLEIIKYHTIEGGDGKFTSIAAASILAKVERDCYIEKLCCENPELIERYGIDSNKGYGSKRHMDGIKEYGITKWHRKTFGICKNYDV